MLDKPLDQITFADLENLVQQKWAEGKALDYKRDIYGPTDAQKKELLKDVSSFANTSGGHLIIGIDEEDGIPTGIPGVSVPSVDEEKLRLEGIIREGIEPRIDFGIHAVSTPQNTTVFIVRVRESWVLPHRVVYGGRFGEFWARNSAGKYSMDTTELRRAFTLSEAVIDRVKAFREHRISEIALGNTPVPVIHGPKSIFHMLPLESFRSRVTIDFSDNHSLSTQFPPIGSGGGDRRRNLDGYVTFAGKMEPGVYRSYAQFYRNAVVEAVTGDIVRSTQFNRKNFHADWYEKSLVTSVRKYVASLRECDVQPPVWCFLTMTEMIGATLRAEGFQMVGYPVDRNTLRMPEIVIDDLSADPCERLRPLCDLIWNAAGFERSFTFDSLRQS